jgi:hypothetical protein
VSEFEIPDADASEQARELVEGSAPEGPIGVEAPEADAVEQQTAASGSTGGLASPEPADREETIAFDEEDYREPQHDAGSGNVDL